MAFCFPEKNPSFWTDRQGARSFPFADGKLRSDVTIIGSGLTGLSVAFHIKSSNPSWKVTVLEKWRVGFGASGRSGGIVVDHPDLVGSAEDSRFLSQFIEDQRITCDLISSPDYPNQRLLNPYLLLSQLCSLCNALGVEVFEGSAVEEVDPETCIASGKRFEIESKIIVYATDSSSSLLGRYAGRVKSRWQNCIVVRLGSKNGESLPFTYYSEHDSHYVWGRRIGSNMFLYGDGEREIETTTPSTDGARAEILASFSNEFPLVDDITLVSAWSGEIGRIENENRQVAQIDNRGRCFFLGGYDGYGIAAAIRGGFVMKSLIEGKNAPSDFPLQSWTCEHVLD